MAFWNKCKKCGRDLWSIVDDQEKEICGKCSGNTKPIFPNENQEPHMDKLGFLGIIQEYIKKNPEWFGDMVMVATQSVRERLDEEMKRNSKHDVALFMAFEAGETNLKKNRANLISVMQALSECASFQGTLAQKGLQEKLKELHA